MGLRKSVPYAVKTAILSKRSLRNLNFPVSILSTTMGMLWGCAMKRYIFILYAFLSALSLLAEEPPEILIPEIIQYYNDINYVATHAKQKELLAIITYIVGSNTDGSFLKEPRLKSLYDKILQLRSFEVSIEPGFHKMTVISPDEFTLTATLVEVLSQTKNHIILKVRRRLPSLTEKDIESIDGLVVHSDSGGIVYELSDNLSSSHSHSSFELHNWVLIDNKWYISAVRFFLISE
jgi:hypothetical protein